MYYDSVFMMNLPSYCVQKEEQGIRTRVAFKRNDEQGKSDDGTPLSGRVSIGDDLALTISKVRPSDEFVFYCQVTAGPSGVGDAPTMLKVFCEFALCHVHFFFHFF